jgi:nucleoid-associated protein YgaU
MDPASALPSYRVYRGSLIALLIGSVFAIWLLVRPGGEIDQAGPPSALAAVLPSATPTKVSTIAAPATSAPGASATPAASPTATASATPAPTASPTPAPTPAKPATYTVKSGDTLYSIADQYRGNTDLQAYIEKLYAANGLTESSLLSLGDVIKLPSP